MKFKIKIEYQNNIYQNLAVHAWRVGGDGFVEGIDFTIDYNPDETVEGLRERVEDEAKSQFEERVVTEKVSIPNVTLVQGEVDSGLSASLAKIKYLDARGEYVKQEFSGPKGSGKSARGGQYAGKHNLRIAEVIELPDKEVWFYSRRESVGAEASGPETSHEASLIDKMDG